MDQASQVNGVLVSSKIDVPTLSLMQLSSESNLVHKLFISMTLPSEKTIFSQADLKHTHESDRILTRSDEIGYA